MAKVSSKPKAEREVIQAKTQDSKKLPTDRGFKWWMARSQKDLADQVLATANFLKQQQSYRWRQAGIYARLYGNMPLSNFVGANASRAATGNNLPIDRPTMNVAQSCTDTLVSRITQSKPRPVFLTDGADYKQRNTAKQMNNFIMGEFFKLKAYQMGEFILRDACVIGDGLTKVFEKDGRVAIERVMNTEILVDFNDALYGFPRQKFQLKLCDRGELMDQIKGKDSLIERAEQAYPDGNTDGQTASDQIIVCEAWHLPSGKDATDGRHVIVCSEGVLLDDPEYKKQDFSFVRLGYSPRLLGYWSQGLVEQLMGTQMEINKLLITISRSINLMGVPRVWLEKGSKVVKAHLSNEIGMVGEYSGTLPHFQDGTSGIAPDMYAQLQRLVDYAYQQSGISALSASAQKPAGLNSGEAIRNYDDLQSDRFAALARRYDNYYIDLAYAVIDKAKEIAERDGSYSTVYPNKDGTKEIDLPKIDLLEDPIFQCFDASSLPRDPAGRLEKVTEMMQAGIIDPQEGRRLLDYPDIEQVDKLANAAEERILQILDQIVESGKYSPPDPFMDLALAEKLVKQYYNLYAAAKLEESKQQQLRDFWTQIQTIKQQATMPPPGMPSAPPGAMPPGAMPPGAGAAPGAAPIAVPNAAPQSDLLPIGQ